ncbi:MAG TPA: T9SS type A sorting domain-containing protein [Chitinophagales bacterium]|nr:T9SS type A sorting domain-containing protein [Chitinophagales bacterium]
MKKQLQILSLILFSSCITNAQITFQKTYDGEGDEWGTLICSTTNGGYFVTGSTTSLGSGDWNVYVIKLDLHGDVIWSETINVLQSEYEVGEVARQTSDGGYILLGRSYVCLPGSNGDDILLVKLDSSGDVEWSHCYGYASHSEGSMDVFLSSDGGYVITAYSYLPGTGADVHIIKTDSNGTVIWSKVYGGTKDDIPYSLTETANGGFVFCGWTYSFDSFYFEQKDIWLTKIDENGELIWSKKYGYGLEWAQSFLQTTDGGFIIAGGGTNSSTAGEDDIFVLRTDSDGNVLWAKTYGDTSCDEAWGIAYTGDGYIISGEKGCYPANDYNMYLVKISDGGELLWAKTFGSNQADRGGRVLYSTDGGFLLSGYRYGYDSTMSDLYLIKTDSYGNSGCYENDVILTVDSPAVIVISVVPAVSSGSNTESDPDLSIGSGAAETTLCLATGINKTVINSDSILIFPNPSSGEVTISLSKNHFTQIMISDLLGKAVRQFSSPYFQKEMTISLADLAKGIYFLQLISDEGIPVRKIIKE